MRAYPTEERSTVTQKQFCGSSETTQGALAAPDNRCVVGVDIGGTNLRLALADSAGVVLAKWSAKTVGIQDANVIVALIKDGVDQLLKQASIPRSSLLAVGAGVAGVTDVDAGVVLATSYLLGWRNIPLRDLLESALGIPAAVDNDVNLGALGESWAGAAKGARDFVFLGIGTGVGAGIMLNGRIFHGMSWAAGEIGYMLVPGVRDDRIEPGKPGPLERLIGGEGIKTEWHNLWRKELTLLPQDLTATQIFDYAVEGEQLAQVLLLQCARTLANVIYNVSLMLNCPLFVLGGTVGMHPALCDSTRSILMGRDMRVQPQLSCSLLGVDAQLAGAICLALDTAAVQSRLTS
jgi:glucokinase